jgi:hypothetical protein
VVTTVSPVASSPTPPSTAQPTGATENQLCTGNLAVFVAVGPRSNPAGGFVEPLQQSLDNIIDCLDPTMGEAHTKASHVWWNPGPLELLFSFGQDGDAESYDISSILFWNYFGEDFDVDSIDFEFFSRNGVSLGTFFFNPRLGANAAAVNANDIVAEQVNLPMVISAVTNVTALLSSTNGQLDFQNFVFLGTPASA